MLLVLLFSLWKCDTNYGVIVNSYAMVCFQEHADPKLGNPVRFKYEVVDGGFLDIDVIITAPNDVVAYKKERQTSGVVEFNPHLVGLYKVCLSNEFSTLTTKVVMFSFTTNGTSDSEFKTNLNEMSNNTSMINVLSQIFSNFQRVREEHYFLSSRNHYKLSQKTNTRVIYFALFQAFMIVLLSIFHIWYLKRFFEYRRII